jgi:excinuclease UvrABC nuclease subunit
MSKQTAERNHIESLLRKLDSRPQRAFPAPRGKLEAPSTHGVYLIRSAAGEVLHVGRTVSGRNGLFQRLRNHLSGKSSFVRSYLNGDASALRNGLSFQFIEVESDRERALLKHRAVAWYCPAHLGLGREGDE